LKQETKTAVILRGFGFGATEVLLEACVKAGFCDECLDCASVTRAACIAARSAAKVCFFFGIIEDAPF